MDQLISYTVLLIDIIWSAWLRKWHGSPSSQIVSTGATGNAAAVPPRKCNSLQRPKGTPMLSLEKQHFMAGYVQNMPNHYMGHTSQNNQCSWSFLLTIQLADRTHCKNTLPLELMKLLMDVPRAGTPQLLQSQPKVTIEPGGIPMMIHKVSLGDRVRGNPMMPTAQPYQWPDPTVCYCMMIASIDYRYYDFPFKLIK